MSDIAKQILANCETETHSLHNVTTQQVHDLAAAFSSPIRCKEMFRVSFVVGAGKKSRQQYDAKVGMSLIQELGTLGFTEDRGAGLSLECQGVYKYQHDTDKDLKYLHVYPRVALLSTEAEADDANTENAALTPTDVCLSAEEDTFTEILKDKVGSLTQKKNLLAILRETKQQVEAIDVKLANLQTPSEEETRLYENAVAVDDKIVIVNKALEKQLKQGDLTKAEVSDLVTKLSDSLALLTVETQKAEGDAKKTKKIEAKVTAVTSQLANVKTVKGKDIKLHAKDELTQLFHKIKQFRKIEQNGGNSLKELQILKEKPEVVDRIVELVNHGEGWFRGREYAEAVDNLELQVRNAAPPKKKSGGAGNASRRADEWSTAQTRGGPKKPQSQTKKRAGNMYDLLAE